jgi:hypothetical protein
MDLTIGSLNFHVRSLGSICILDLAKLDPSASETKIIVMSESSVGSSSKVNSPVSFATTENIGEKIEELDETMGNLDLGGTTDQTYLSKKDFTTRSGGVSSNIHQLCVIITEGAEENNDTNNAATHAQVGKPRSNNKKEKEKIHVSTGEWRVIMSAINHGTEVPANSRREVLMGYQYALHQHKKKLREDEEEDFTQETPEAALVAAQAYLVTTQSEPEDPREHMHQAAIKSLGLVEDRLRKHSPEKKSTCYEDKEKKIIKYQSSQSQTNDSSGDEKRKARREDARNIIAQARVNKACYAWKEENYEDDEKEMGTLCFTRRVDASTQRI